MHPSRCLCWTITIQGFWSLPVLRGFAETLQIRPQSLPACNNDYQPVAFCLVQCVLLNTSQSCGSFFEFLFVYSTNRFSCLVYYRGQFLTLSHPLSVSSFLSGLMLFASCTCSEGKTGPVTNSVLGWGWPGQERQDRGLPGRGPLLTPRLSLVWPPQINWEVAGWAKREKRVFSNRV